MEKYWEFYERKQWNVMGQNPSKVINENIREGFKYFIIKIKGNNYQIHINTDNKTGHQQNIKTNTILSIRLSDTEISSAASAWGGQSSSSGASAWGGQPSRTDLDNMIEHCNNRFLCLHRMLVANPSLEIIIPSDDKKTTNMGKGYAIGQWKNKRDYKTFIQHLDKKMDELHKKDSSRVKFGRLKRLDKPNIIQLWGANLKNYDYTASTYAGNGNIIKGSGQAAFLKKHTQSTYGIITTPVGGVPQQRKNDFDMNRLCSRNPSVSVSQGGTSARSLSRVGKPNNRGILSRGQSSFRLQNTKHKVIDNFKPSTKINVPKRKVQQFIDDFKKASKSKGGYKLAKKELEDGEKKKHWFWYVFPQPLNIYDKLHISPAQVSQTSRKYCFNSNEEAFAFIKDHELRQKYFNCLQLILENKDKSISEIMQDDTDKFITSVNHIKLTLNEYINDHGDIVYVPPRGNLNQKNYVKGTTMLQYIIENEHKLNNPLRVGKLYKKKSNKKKSNKKKSNKKKSNKKKSN